MATGGDPVFQSGGKGDVRHEKCDVKTVSPTKKSSDECDHDYEKDFPVKDADAQQASDCFAARMSGMMSDKDLQRILLCQEKSLSNFEKTNEKFGRFNELSATKYDSVHQHFKSHTKVLIDMKKDLETVFRRIRTLKGKLNKAYPTAFIATSENIKKLEEELGASGEQDDRKDIQELRSTTERKLCVGDEANALKDKVDLNITEVPQSEKQTEISPKTAEVHKTTTLLNVTDTSSKADDDTAAEEEGQKE